MKLQELFSDSSKWTQGCMAKDKNGLTVFPKDCKAVSWCLIGGMNKCCPNIQQFTTMVNAAYCLLKRSISDWNDFPDRKFDDIVKLCKDLDI
jgi:hypothetical protein